MGRIEVWLTTDQAPYLRGPFSLLAEFSQSDPPGDLVPVLLGHEFLLAHQAEFQLQLPPQHALIVCPEPSQPARRPSAGARPGR